MITIPAGAPENVPSESAKLPVTTWLLLMFKSGSAKGKRELTLVIHSPSGKKQESLKQELARRQAELSARQEQSGVSNDAVEAVNMELLRIQHSLDETKLQLSEAVQGRQRAEASLQMDQANLLSQSKETINVAQWQERIAELQADIADGHAVETELRADAQALRDEIVELRGVSEEAEGRYAIATQASQELTETHQRSEGEWTAALASAKWEAQVAVAARQIVETALAAGQESDAKLAGALQETQTLLAASQQEAESLRLARVQETGIALAASQQEMEAMLAAVRREAEARTEAMGQKANGEALAARDAEHQEELRNAQAAVDARQTQHQEELSNSQAASVARETQLQEQLRDTEAALAEARESASVQAAAALAPPPASSQELSALRDLVLRLEGSLGETARERNGAIESLTSEVAGLKQIAALGRAICDGAARYATHADQLRINFDAALQALHQGNTAFASEVLGPVRQLQSALNPLAAAQPSGASVNDIGALQQAVDPVPPVVTVPEGLQAVV